MDTVRALLLVSPDAKPPSTVPDATLLDLRALTAEQRDGARAATQALIDAGQRVYLHIHSVQSGEARDDLVASLIPGVYGVSVSDVLTAQQLQYLDSTLEDLEARAEIRAGLTAIGAWVASARGVQALDALAAGSHRLTWVGLDEAALAADLGLDVEPDDDDAEEVHPTLAHARAQLTLAARANDLPSVLGAPPHEDGRRAAARAAAASAAGLCGGLTMDARLVENFKSAFPSAPDTGTA